MTIKLLYKVKEKVNLIFDDDNRRFIALLILLSKSRYTDSKNRKHKIESKNIFKDTTEI